MGESGVKVGCWPRKRPLLEVALLYTSGILLGQLVPLPLWPLLLTALLLAATAVLWERSRSLLLYPLLILTGCADLTLHRAVLSPDDLRLVLGAQPQLATIRGVLSETPGLRVYELGETASWRTQGRLEVSAVRIQKEDWRPAVGRIAVTTPGMLTSLFGGQSVEVYGVAAPPKMAVAEGTFDYRAFLDQQGIYYQLQTESEQDWRILSSPAVPPLVDRFRNWARQAIARGLPGEDESLRLEWALTLGWKTALTEEVAEPFVQAATYHIFAVDGLRMAIVFGIFFSLLRALGVPRAWAGLLLLPVIWCYVALTGWPASAIRATVMLTVIILGWALKRPSDLINSLLAAAVIILVWEPQQLFQAGFQLSFFVVLCLILVLPPLWAAVERFLEPDPLLPKQLHRRWPPVLARPARYLGDLWLTSFAAWIGSIPLVAYYFNIVTPVSTPANLVAVPLCGLVLISNLTSLLLVGWFPAAADLFNHAGWFCMECIRVSSHWFALWPKAYLYVPAPSLFTTCLYYAVLLAVVTGWLFRPAWRGWKFAGFGAACLAWCGMLWHNWVPARLTILPANGGAVVYCDGRGAAHDLLVDTGNTNAVQFVVKPFLRAQGVNRLPAVALTHGDLHHVGGAETLARLFAVGQMEVGPLRFRSRAYRQTLERLGRYPGLVRTNSRNNQLAGWVVLHPGATDRFARADDGALVLRDEILGTRVLLLSDLGPAGQRALLERTSDLRADIVVTGLPTGTEPLGDDLLAAIQPRVIIIADSEFPASERAPPRLEERLATCGIPVIYTRKAGAVTIELRPQRWRIHAMNGRNLASETRTSVRLQSEVERGD